MDIKHALTTLQIFILFKTNVCCMYIQQSEVFGMFFHSKCASNICMFLHSATNPMVKFLQGSAEVLVQKPNIHSGALELVLQISAAGLSSHGTAGGWSIFCF